MQSANGQRHPSIRARDLGIALDGITGANNALTDIADVSVGYTTLRDPDTGVFTGVTAILPRARADIGLPCAAGTFSLNGNGEMTGRAWIDEAGQFSTPILLTNSHAVGACHSGVVSWLHRHYPHLSEQWLLPVVAETWDGYLNRINEPAIQPEHAQMALDTAAAGPIAEGSVGGGTGMTCYAYKGGCGTASRVFEACGGTYTLAAFMQANFGRRSELNIAGVPIGRLSRAPNPMETEQWLAPLDGSPSGSRSGAGSVIVVIATDAPLLPRQLEAVARRVPLGLARTGTTGSHFSGDIFLAFSTANKGALQSILPARTSMPGTSLLDFIPWGHVDPVYEATVQCVEEAVLNALVNNADMTGRDGHYIPALPASEARRLMSGYVYPRS